MRLLASLKPDLTASVRHAARRPGLIAAMAATLAVTIAGATTAFGVAAAVLWRPLPFADEANLVFVWEEAERDGQRTPSRVTGFRYAGWRDERGVLTSTAMFASAGFTLETPDGAESIRGVRVSPRYFETLGIQLLHGRTFGPSEEQPGNNQVVVLSEPFWRERFGGRADAIGQTLQLSGRPYTIVGVARQAVYPGWPTNPAVVSIDPQSQRFWVPIVRTPQLDQSGRAHVFGVVARLAPGVTLEQAAESLNRRIDPSALDSHAVRVTPLRDQFVRDARTPLLALLGAALATLLIACTNLAALQLSAFEARRSEFAVRAAIGASTGRLIQQIGVEALLLVTAGGIPGILLAGVALAWLPQILPESVPLLTAVTMDPRVAMFGLGLAAFACAIIAGWPVVRLAAAAPAPRGVAVQARSGVYRTLVVSQIAMAVALTSAAALLARSFNSVRAEQTGFDINDVLIAQIGLPTAGTPDPRAIAVREQALLTAVSTTPGVRAVAAAYDHPLQANWSEAPTIVGDATAPDQRAQSELRIVSPGYFEALTVPLLDGRALSERDDLEAPGAAVVNEAFARQLGGRALGRRIRSGTPQFLYGTAAPSEFEIVGVVGNERFRGLEAPALPAFYLSTRQFPQTGFVLLARTARDPLAVAAVVRARIRQLDAGITFNAPTTLEGVLGEQLMERRVTARVMSGFAVAALGLAAVGLYALLVMLVANRRRDIGIELALGASRQRIAAAVLRESAVNAAAGITLGVVLAVITGRLIRALLVGVSPADPMTIGTVVATLAVVSMAAACAPAIRASRVDPISALRGEP
jgi:putative ABC transport system permease protein